MLGKILLTVDAVALIVCAPFFDYNETHIFNPRWPPHAKQVKCMVNLYGELSYLTKCLHQISRRSDYNSLRSPGSRNPVFHLPTAILLLRPGWGAGSCKEVAQAGLCASGPIHGYHLLDCGDGVYPVPGNRRCGSRVRDSGDFPAGARFHHIHGPGGFRVASGRLIWHKWLAQLAIDRFFICGRSVQSRQRCCCKPRLAKEI